MNKIPSTSKWTDDIKCQIDLIESATEEEAREHFNKVMYSRWNKLIRSDDSPYTILLPFWVEIEELMNHSHARELHVATTKSVLGYFYSEEYKEDLQQIERQLHQDGRAV